MIFSRKPYRTHRKGWKVVKGTLPTDMIKAVESRLSDPNEFHRAIHCLVILFNKFLNQDMLIDDSLEVSDTYKDYIFHGNRGYHFLLTTIIVDKLNILERVLLPGGRKWARNKPCRYRFNPTYIVDQKIQTFYYEDRESISRVKPTKKGNLTPLPQRAQGSLEGALQSVLDRVTVTLNEKQIESFVKSRQSDISETIRNRCKLKKNGNIHYSKDGKTKIIKKGRYKSLDHFVECRTCLVMQSHINALQRFAGRQNLDTFPSRDKYSGRMYHDLINIPKAYLHLLRLDGERLCEIDLRNSQLCFFAHVLARAGIMRTPAQLYKGICNTLISSFMGKEETITDIRAYLSSHFSNKPIDSNNQSILAEKQVHDWINSCFHGDIYETVSKALASGYGGSIKTRDEIKSLMFQIWFCDHRYSKMGTDKQALWNAFGEVMTIITGVKSHLSTLLIPGAIPIKPTIDIHGIVSNCDDVLDKAGSNLFCIAHQRIESLVFIDSLLLELFALHFSCIPKHDSILCKESDFNSVLEIMEKELGVILGIDNYTLNCKSFWN